VPALAGIALAVGAVPADDQACVDEERQVPPHRRRRHAVRPQRDLLVRRKDDEIVPCQDGLWVKGQEGVQHRERALAEAEPCADRAKGAKDLPFVHRRFGRALLCDHLACDLGKRQRSPPKGRRWQDRFHSSSPSFRQKETARRNGVDTLDSDSRRPYSLSAKSSFVGLPGRRRSGSVFFARCSSLGGWSGWIAA